MGLNGFPSHPTFPAELDPLVKKVRKARPSARPEILREFARLVAEKGYSETSIANVADALGLSKGTIAFHFGAKEVLLRSLTDSYMSRRLEEARWICTGLKTPTHQLCGMIYALLAVNRDDRDSAHTFRREFIRFKDPTSNYDLREQRGAYFAIMHDIISRGMATREFRTDDARIIALQIFGMCNYAWTWLRTDGDLNIETIAETFCSTFVDGLRGPAAIGDRADIHNIMEAAIRVVLSAPNRSL